MLKGLAVDEVALNYLFGAEQLSADWLDTLDTKESEQLKRREVEGIVYLLSSRASIDSRLVVFSIEDGRLFGAIDDPNDRIEAFSRALRASLRLLDPTITIPSGWRQYLKGNRYLSIQSNNIGTGRNSRIYLDRAPERSSHVYVYALGNLDHDSDDLYPKYDLYHRAVASFSQALESSKQPTSEVITPSKGQLDLTEQIQEDFSKGLTTEQWYRSKLTAEQLRFVDHPVDQSVRLQGAAGTGKTLAMIIKCIRLMHAAIEQGRFVRIAFLTHSLATVELVRAIVSSIDEKQILVTKPKEIDLTITTLQKLANDALSLDYEGLEPLSDDGIRGRQEQLDILAEILPDYRNGDWVALKSQCSERIRALMEKDVSSTESVQFRWELMNEFACVLDADSVRDYADKRAKYVRDKSRPQWMMLLPEPSDRQMVIDLYDRFRKHLQEYRYLGLDQVIADYLQYLDGFKWDLLRKDRGFDYIFVDELHQFNRQERMAFHHLTRDTSKPPRVTMAFDAKQSSKATFVRLNAGSDIWRETKLGVVDRFEFNEVFRYSPEILHLLRSIDQQFPAVDLDEDWPDYKGFTKLPPSDKPTIRALASTKEMYQYVFPRAASHVKRFGKGRNVAVLCCEHELFDVYVKAGEHKGLFVPITSREDLSKLAYAGKKFILSMPEYVAGLQFECVLLIDVNDFAVPRNSGAGNVRRFVSQVYLGASRSEKVLELYSSEERGGVSRFLAHSIEDGFLVTAGV
jgi:hypothetical protein